jgi:cytochrome c553
MDSKQKELFGVGIVLLATAFGLSGCSEYTATLSQGDSKTGEVVALGGGGAGAGNACISCHGLQGQGDGISVPYLASMDEGYLLRQLDDYASARRQHAAMSKIAKRLTPSERASVAMYYERLDFTLPSREPLVVNQLYNEGDASRGLASCASCHGENGEGQGAPNPPLAQQPAAFLEAQLRAWKRGGRQNDPEHVMLVISQLLTEKEIVGISAYLSKLPRVRQPQALATYQQERHADPRSDVSVPRQYVRE